VDVPPDRSHGEQILYPGRAVPMKSWRGAVHVALDPADGVLISVPMRNAGNGLAVVRGISLEVGEPIPSPLASIRPANIASGEYSRVSFLASRDDRAFAAIGRALAPGYATFSVIVGYSDLAGQQMTLSRFDVHGPSRAHPEWEVRQVHLQDPGADEPFSGSAPTA